MIEHIDTGPGFLPLASDNSAQTLRKLCLGALTNLMLLLAIFWLIPSQSEENAEHRIRRIVTLSAPPQQLTPPKRERSPQVAVKPKEFAGKLTPVPEAAPKLEIPTRIEPPPQKQLLEVPATPVVAASTEPVRPPKPAPRRFDDAIEPNSKTPHKVDPVTMGSLDAASSEQKRPIQAAVIESSAFSNSLASPALRSSAGTTLRQESGFNLMAAGKIENRQSKEVAIEGSFGSRDNARPSLRSTPTLQASSFDSSPGTSSRKGIERRQDPDSEFKPVEILSKPRPLYTEEARRFGIEGEVLVRILFGADGKLKVLSVVQGLGHGLDENAALAATQIQFRPAIKQGRAVEQAAVVRVQFQLAN